MKMTMISLIGNAQFGQNFEMTKISLINNAEPRTRTEFQNDYGILNSYTQMYDLTVIR